MRVGINTFFLRMPATGSGQYVQHLLDEMSPLAPDDEFILCGPPAGSLAPNQSARVLNGTSNTRKAWMEQVTLPLACWQARVDLIHYPYFAAPLISSVPVVVTVHDLIPLLMPEYIVSRRVLAYTRLVTQTTRRAAMVITDSEASRRDIVEKMRVPPERVRVVYLGVDACSLQAAPEAEMREVRRRYRLDKPFLLYLGGMDPRKNVPVLVRAYARARRRMQVDADLVIAGPQPERAGLPGLAIELGIAGAVRILGPVDEKTKWLLYRMAEAFIFPSSYEGFGLPPLEAMACGTPVVCSNASSLPEVVGDAAIMVDPRDESGIADAICQVVDDSALASRLRQAGPPRAAQFNWERTARQTLQIYQEVAGR